MVLNTTIVEKNRSNFKNIKMGIFSSSSGIAFNYKNRIEETTKIFEEINIDIVLGHLWGKNNHYVSDSIMDRGKEFNALLNEFNIMMSMIGGYNSSSILSLIDYEKIIKNKN